MIRTIDGVAQAFINSGEITGVILARLHFGPSNIYRYCNAYQSIYWDEAGTGEVEYTGVGNLASISPITETGELAAQTIQVSLSGIPNQHITDIFSNDYINQPIYIWYGILNSDTYAIYGGQTGPILLYAGLMDFGVVEFGETATITVNATSRLADWERPRGGRFNLANQQTYVDPTDLGMRYIETLQNVPIAWGGHSLQNPGSSNRGSQVRGADYYSGEGSRD